MMRKQNRLRAAALQLCRQPIFLGVLQSVIFVAGIETDQLPVCVTKVEITCFLAEFPQRSIEIPEASAVHFMIGIERQIAAFVWRRPVLRDHIQKSSLT